MTNQRYISILDEIKKSGGEIDTGKPNDSVLLIDGMNLFIRVFSAIPTTNDDGIHIGGIVGFLRSLAYSINMIRPTRTIIVFDGKGGSNRRRKIFPEYKMGRKMSYRLNRAHDFLTREEEQKMMIRQLNRVVEYLECLPVNIINMEALFFSPFIILAIACILGFFAAWGIGANDVANAMGTSVGSKALTLKQAVIIAAIFEFLGAFLAGGEVTSTIRKGIVDPLLYQDDVNIFIVGMMATLLATGSWLLLASRNGWPVSTTHSIVGAIVGFVLITKGSGAVSWDKIFEIASSWITSPLISALLAFLIFKSVKMLIIDSKNRSKAAVNLIPIYVILVVFVILQVTFRKGLVHIGLVWENSEIIQYSLILSLVIGIVSFLYLRSRSSDFGSKAGIETAFSLLMVVAACAMAFAHEQKP